jgi:lipid II:glycine glycyltransferase (peptidoglycan interpeptide bridge formation enzyme)
MDGGGHRVEQRPSSTLWAAVAEAGTSREWDDFVLRAGGDIAQSSAWAGFKRSVGMEVTRVVVRDGDTIVAGAQLVARTLFSRVRIGYVSQGPLVAACAPPATTSTLASALRSLSVAALFVQPPIGADHMASVLRAHGFGESHTLVGSSASMQIDLRLCEDELLAQMQRHARKEICSTANADVAVRCGTRKDLTSFYELYRCSAERQRFQPLPFRYFEALWSSLHEDGHLHLFLADINGIPVAANIVTAFGSQVTGKFVGFDPLGVARRYRPNEKLVWTIMTWARAAGYTTLDVGGIERDEAQQLVRGLPIAKPCEPHKYKYGGEPVIAPAPLLHIKGRVLRAGYRVTTSRHFDRFRSPLEYAARSGRA